MRRKPVMSNRISNSIRAVIGCFGLRLTVVCFVFILGAPRAQADVGVPMLAVMAVPMWLSLLVIIPLEAAIARRLLPIGWSRCFKLSILANLASTLLGIPITWCALAAAEWVFGPWLAYSFQQQLGLSHTVTDIMSVILFSPWLLPINSDLYWMVPTTSLVLCIPFFFASVWSENLVARRILESGLHNQALNWAWKANIASYILIALTTVGFLMVSLADHKKVASDDEHRNVDLVSIDRLWDIAVANAKDAKHNQEVSNQEYASRLTSFVYSRMNTSSIEVVSNW